MKKILLFTCIFTLALTACRKPEPGNGLNGNETTDTLVKKYLVKQLLNDDPERIMLDIDWNDDCSRILHVKYGLGYGSIIDYDFNYFGEDSIRVTLSLPPNSYPLWELWYDMLMIHLTDNRIDSISCYVNGELSRLEHYFYNDEGKLTKREYGGEFDIFDWNEDDVIRCKMYGMSSPITIDSFSNYIYPQYTLPFYLANEVAFEVRQPLFTPLWKHQPIYSYYNEYQSDEDGYIIKMAHNTPSDSLKKSITFYYTTPKNSSK